MPGVETTDRTQHIAEVLLKTGSALEEVFQYYKVGRHESTFTGKSYFLLSHCAHLLFSLRSADEDSGGALLRHASGSATFLAELDCGPLRHADYKRRTHHTDSLDDHLKNEPKWFDFWMELLERLDPREAQSHREFTQRVLTYVGYRGFLEGKAVRKNKMILDDLMKTVTTGRILLRTMSVLEDMIRVITSHFATLDAKTCMDGQVTALACLLGQIRRTIVWEAPATGPYAPRGAKSWRMPMSLAWLHLGASEGTLRLVPKREGGEIICSYHWTSKSARKRRSWTVKTSALQRTYEQELFATWSRDTGEYLEDPGRFPEASASWNVQNAEADRLENLSRQADLVLNALRTSPASRGLIGAVTPILRNGATRWKATELPWTYIRQLDKLLNKLTFACREAKVLGGENPAEQVVRQIWPSEQPTQIQARPEPTPSRPAETTTDDAPAQMTPEKDSVPEPTAQPEQLRPEEATAEKPQPPPDAEQLEPDEPQEQVRAEHFGAPSEVPPTPEAAATDSVELRLCIPTVEDIPQYDEDAPASQDIPAVDDTDTRRQVTAPSTRERCEEPEPTPRAEQPLEHIERPGIDLFSAITPAPSEDSEQQPICGPTKPKDQSVNADSAVLLQRLQEHHHPASGEVEYAPLSLVQLTSDLAWNRSRVQRAMTDLFGPKPFTAYKERCKDRTIADFLHRLDDDGTQTLIAPACTMA